jgi:hypothetical protein
MTYENEQEKGAICREEFVGTGRMGTAPVVDHCHITGENRAMLCQRCNKGIGMMRENITILQNAIRYIALFKE